MYSHFSFSPHLAKRLNPQLLAVLGQHEFGARMSRLQWLLVGGNCSMLLGCILTLLSVLASYGLTQELSMAAQIVAHISTLIFATLVKFGYIARCVALNGLNKEQWS